MKLSYSLLLIGNLIVIITFLSSFSLSNEINSTIIYNPPIQYDFFFTRTSEGIDTIYSKLENINENNNFCKDTEILLNEIKIENDFCKDIFCNVDNNVIFNIFLNLTKNLENYNFHPIIENLNINLQNNKSLSLQNIIKIYNYCNICKFNYLFTLQKENKCNLPFQWNVTTNTINELTFGQPCYKINQNHYSFLTLIYYPSLNSPPSYYSYFPVHLCFCKETNSFSSICDDDWNKLFYTNDFQNIIRSIFITFYLIEFLVYLIFILIPLMVKKLINNNNLLKQDHKILKKFKLINLKYCIRDFRIIATIIAMITQIIGIFSLISLFHTSIRLILITINCIFCLIGVIPIVFQWLFVLKKMVNESLDVLDENNFCKLRLLVLIVFILTFLLILSFIITISIVSSLHSVLDLVKYIIINILFIYSLITISILIGYGMKVYFKILRKRITNISFFQFKFTKYLFIESITFIYFMIYIIYYIISVPFVYTTFTFVANRFMLVFPWTITHAIIILSLINRIYFLGDYSCIYLFYYQCIYFPIFKKSKEKELLNNLLNSNNTTTTSTTEIKEYYYTRSNSTCSNDSRTSIVNNNTTTNGAEEEEMIDKQIYFKLF